MKNAIATVSCLLSMVILAQEREPSVVPRPLPPLPPPVIRPVNVRADEKPVDGRRGPVWRRAGRQRKRSGASSGQQG